MKVAELVALGEIAFQERPRPLPGPGEAVVRVQAVGLCTTDVKACFRGHVYFAPPCVLGHEFSGIVDEVGCDVDRFCVGNAVVAAPYVECGQCALCRQELGELCQHKSFIAGSLQEYVLLPRRIVELAAFVIPLTLDPVVATLAEPLACVHNAVERARVGAGDDVLVIGAGPMGVMLALVARSLGARVVVTERSPTRVHSASHLGLTVVNTVEQDLTEYLTAHWQRQDARVVFVAVGSPTAVEQSGRLVAPGGILLAFGGMPGGERVCLDAHAIHYREIIVTGSFGFRMDQFRRAVSWLSDHVDEARAVVTDIVPFSDVLGALQRVRDGQGLKTVVSFLPE